jgi:hypothetical protein
MKKKFLFFLQINLLILPLMTVTIHAADFSSLHDIPFINERYDISVSISDRGTRFLHVQSYFHDDFPEAFFQLFYNEYSENNHLLRFNKTPVQRESDFHFLVDYGHLYELCIVAIQNQNISGATTIQRIIPSTLISVQRNDYSVNDVPQSRKRNNQNQNLSVTLDISQQNFPLINLTSAILYDGLPFDGNNYEKLDISNFLVKEDNRIQTIRRIFAPASQGNSRIVDILFVIDVSRSMVNEAEAVKKTVSAFGDKFEQNRIDFRIALLPYGGNFSYSTPEGTVLHNGIFHDTATAFMNDVNQMKFDGGTECSYNAMEKALYGYQWRPVTQKLLFLITDEPHDTSCVYSEKKILDALRKELNLILYIVCPSTEHSYDFFDNGFINVKIKKDLDNQQGLEVVFNNIFKEINEDIINQYIVQYETDNRTIDGNCRTVELTVDFEHPTNGNIINSDSTQYCPNQILTLMLSPETEQLSNAPQRKNAPLKIEAMLKQTTSAGAPLPYTLTLHYTNSSVSSFKTVEMKPNSFDSQLFQTTIPAADVLQPYIKYYIVASGDKGKYTYPADQPSYTPVVISVMPNTPPIIKHQPVINTLQNTSISIKAEVEDVSAYLKSVTLFYRKKGDFLYQSISKSTSDKQVLFEAVIPEASVSSHGVQYYIVAMDNHGASNAIGTAEEPLEIFVSNPDTPDLPMKTIGNIVIFADEFIQDDTDDYITRASGNVMIGTTSGNGPLIKTSTSLLLHYDKRSVTSLSTGDIIAVNIKRDTISYPEHIPLYSGSFEIDCISNPPVLNSSSGSSLLKLVQNIPFYFPSENFRISLGSDELTLYDLRLQLSQGFHMNLSIGNIILSQSGNTTQKCTTRESLNTACPYDRSKSLVISDLQFEFDLLAQSYQGNGELLVSNIIGFQDKGISASFECQQNPFSIQSISGEIKYSNYPQEDVILPSTYDQTLHLVISNGVYHLDLSEKLPVITGYGEIVFRDADGIISSVNQHSKHEFLHGNMNFSIDLSGKTILSGDMWLFDRIHLTNATLVVRIPYKISADLNIQENLLGQLDLSVWKSKNQVEISGLNVMNWNIPKDTPWLGGQSIQNHMVSLLVQLSSKGVEQAGFESNYHLFFMPFSISLDIAPDSDLKIQVKGWQDISSSHTITPANNNQLNFNINQMYTQLAIVSSCDKQSVNFDIEFSDTKGNLKSYSSEEVSPFMGNDSEFPMTINDIFFMKNMDTHESCYAINHPIGGDYKLTIKNASDIGNYQMKLFIPDPIPSIQLLAPSSDQIVKAGQNVSIRWHTENADDNAQISFYIGDDMSGTNGIRIQTNLNEGSTSNTCIWTVTDDIPAGTYFIYASLSDNKHAPVFSCSTARMTVTKENISSVPEYVVAIPQEGGTKILWNPVSDSDILGYRLHVSETTETKQSVYDIGVGTDAEYLLMGLKQNQSYGIAVSVIDSQGNESQLSQPVTFVSTTEGEGGNPDLILNIEDSCVTYTTGEPMRITAVIKNIGNYTAYSANISCYYGPATPQNLIQSQMMPELSPEKNHPLTFRIDEYSDLSKNKGGKDIYITIGDVELQDINTENNVGVIPNDTLFNARNGLIFQSANGYQLELVPGNFILTQLKCIAPESITDTKDKPENFSYDLIEMTFETFNETNVEIIFPKALPENFKLYSHTSENGWQALPHTTDTAKKSVLVKFTDGGMCDEDNVQNSSIKSIFGLAVLPETDHVVESKSEDSSSCFISILKNN